MRQQKYEFKGGLLGIVILFIVGCTINKKESRIFGDLGLTDSIVIDRPFKRFESFENFIYCYDFLDKSLVKLDRDFNPLVTQGKWGEGPKENLMVRNFQVLDQQRLSIFDTEKHTFKIQDFSDSVFFYRKFSIPMERGVQIGDDLLILVATKQGIKLSYSTHSLSQNNYSPIRKIDELFDFENSALVYEGKIMAHKGRLIHTSYFSDLWFTYDPSNDSLERGSYIFDFETPKVFAVGGGAMLDNAPLLVADTFVNGDFLAVISNVSDRQYPENRVLDLYNLDSKKYVKSFILPNLNGTKASEGFVFSRDIVGLLYEDKVYLFRLR